MGMSVQWLAVEEWPKEKHFEFELQLMRSISTFNTDSDNDTYSTTWASATIHTLWALLWKKWNVNQHFHCVCWAEVKMAMEKRFQFQYQASATIQQLMMTWVEGEMTINTSTLFVKRKLTSPQISISNFDEPVYNWLCQIWHDMETNLTTWPSERKPATINSFTLFVEHKLTSVPRSVYNFDLPPYTRLWALLFTSTMMIFRCICRAEVHICTEKHLKFRSWQYIPWLWRWGCIWESMKLPLLGAVPSIQYTASTVGLYIFPNTITVLQESVSPSVERLTGSDDSWRRQHNQLLILGIVTRLTPPMAWVGERSIGRSLGHGMVWLLSSVFCLLSCFLSVFQCLSVWWTW